ncbi:MAG TPA: TraR/DksA family transcriptional regulator [Blastocatellia bacterium]|nr:TraR/DksA family transcriptional regulator [Blastocatellia bacterium]
MDKKRIKLFQDRLVEKHRALTGVVTSTEDYEREAGLDTSQDPADIASNAYTKDLLFSQSSNERMILRLVEEALRRIEVGSYGYCVNCEEEIQPKRLEAVPWARHCIKCQDLQERGLLEEDRE